MADDHDLLREARWSQLMAAAQDGDRASYETLLRETVPLVRAIASRWHRSPDSAEDVVQDVLLTLHRVRHTYDPSRPFTHWIATLARRRAIDALRRRGRTDRFESFDERAYETFADPATNRDLMARETGAALKQAMSALTEGQRQAIELLKLNELSLAEATKVTGKSVGALKVNVHRAMKALKARMGGD